MTEDNRCCGVLVMDVNLGAMRCDAALSQPIASETYVLHSHRVRSVGDVLALT